MTLINYGKIGGHPGVSNAPAFSPTHQERERARRLRVAREKREKALERCGEFRRSVSR